MWCEVSAATPAAWMSWSTGKDSSAALHAARHELGLEVVGLLSTVNAGADRVAMHAVRRSLLEEQANRLGLPLHVVEIPAGCPNDLYDAQMADALRVAADAGVTSVVFGDLFLEDVRAYRQERLRQMGLQAVFPLWGLPTHELARRILDAGVRAVVTCLDPRHLPPGLAGHAYDRDFLAALPPSVDPCGERGEFHTFVWDGPGFSAPIDVVLGEVVHRDGFVFCDVLPT